MFKIAHTRQFMFNAAAIMKATASKRFLSIFDICNSFINQYFTVFHAVFGINQN